MANESIFKIRSDSQSSVLIAATQQIISQTPLIKKEVDFFRVSRSVPMGHCQFATAPICIGAV